MTRPFRTSLAALALLLVLAFVVLLPRLASAATVAPVLAVSFASTALLFLESAALRVVVDPTFLAALLALVYVAFIRGKASREKWFTEAVDGAFWIAEGLKGQKGAVGTVATKADAALAALKANAARKGETLTAAAIATAQAAWAAQAQRTKPAVAPVAVKA